MRYTFERYMQGSLFEHKIPAAVGLLDLIGDADEYSATLPELINRLGMAKQFNPRKRWDVGRFGDHIGGMCEEALLSEVTCVQWMRGKIVFRRDVPPDEARGMKDFMAHFGRRKVVREVNS